MAPVFATFASFAKRERRSSHRSPWKPRRRPTALHRTHHHEASTHLRGHQEREHPRRTVELLDEPIADSTALCIPTAGYGYPEGDRPGNAGRFISGREPRCPMCELGWKSLGVLELTALPSIAAERWVRWVREADALLVNGGDALYLCHWMRQSGLAAGVVDFSIFPHLDHPDLPENTMAMAERWAAAIGNPAYAIDDQTAINVVDDIVGVVSEGHWKLFAPERKG